MLFDPELADDRSKMREMVSVESPLITSPGPVTTTSTVCGEIEEIFNPAGVFLVFIEMVIVLESGALARLIVTETLEILPSILTPAGISSKTLVVKFLLMPSIFTGWVEIAVSCRRASAEPITLSIDGLVLTEETYKPLAGVPEVSTLIPRFFTFPALTIFTLAVTCAGR